MTEGKYFKIPEGPADMERLWQEAEPLDALTRPAWLSAEEAGDYRLAGSARWHSTPGHEPEGYAAEVEALTHAGIVIDQDLHDPAVSRFYLPEPSTAWFNKVVWSIGIFTGQSPLELRSPLGVKNPVLTRDDVTDVRAVFIADPFMVHVDDTWCMFFEVMDWKTDRGAIGLATSGDGQKWTYQRIVLAEPFHLSYPYVFQWKNDYYMIPESYQAGAVRLYKAQNFPYEWSHVADLLSGPYFADASPFRHAGTWWLYADTSDDQKHDTLRLYHAWDLLGPWAEHPQSPLIVGNARIARPAGRVLVANSRLIRYAQNCVPYYGTAVRAFEVTELTRTTYQECEAAQSPVLKAGDTKWNACGMHHLDAHLLQDGHWIAAVDGWFSDKLLSS